MANSLTIEQKGQELQVGDRRAIKTSLTPSLYISMEEGASIATPTQGEQTEGVRENNSISAFTSLRLQTWVGRPRPQAQLPETGHLSGAT